MKEKRIAFEKELMDVYLKGKPSLPRRDAEDLLRCLVGFMKKEVSTGSTPAFNLEVIGKMYINQKNARKRMTIETPPNNSQRRFERVQMMGMDSPPAPLITNRLFSGGFLVEFEKDYGATIEDMEQIQNEV